MLRHGSRRFTISAALIAGTVAAGLGGLLVVRGAGEPLGAGSQPAATTPEAAPYDPGITLNTPIPAGAQPDPRSDPIIERLVHNTRDTRAQIASRDETPPIYEVQPSDPFLRVSVDGREIRFRVPEDAQPGGGTDFPLVLLDRAHPDLGPFVELRVFRARIDRERGVLDGEGMSVAHYNNDGRRLNPDGSRSSGGPFLGDGTGSGLSILTGLIRPEEIDAGRINHAIRFAYSSVDSTDTFRPPAVKTDQPKDGETREPASAMEMGMRLQLDPGVDCSRRTVPGKDERARETRFLRILCRALQAYGMVMLDGTAPGLLMLQMEGGATAGWRQVIGEEGPGVYGYIIRSQDSPDDGLDRDDRSGIPWDRMRVLAAEPAP